MLDSLLKALPSAAASPLALAAYIAVLLAWIVVSITIKRQKQLLDKLQLIPDDQRVELVTREMGDAYLMEGMTASEWIRARKHRFVFCAVMLTLLAAMIIALSALWSSASISQENVEAERTVSSLAEDATQWLALYEMVLRRVNTPEYTRTRSEFDDQTTKLLGSGNARDRLILRHFGESARQEFQINILGEITVIRDSLNITTTDNLNQLALALAFSFKLRRFLAQLDALIPRNNNNGEQQNLHSRNWIVADSHLPDAFSNDDPVARQLAKMRGKVVVIDFMATWCAPCLTEIPRLKAFYAKEYPNGVDFLTIFVWSTPKQVSSLQEKFPFPWPIIAVDKSDTKACDRWMVSYVPTKYLIGVDGTPLKRFSAIEQISVEDLAAAKNSQRTFAAAK